MFPSIHVSTFLFFIFLSTIAALPQLPDPVPESTHTFLPSPSSPATIPAFPEQSDVAGCPLDLSDDLFHGIKSACSNGKTKHGASHSELDQLHRSRCCPVLAAWLYSAYSKTALHGVPQTTSYDLPLLPNDSETCVDNLEKALETKGIDLVKPNETCDVVYCYCGIRLHPLSCPEAFSVSSKGKFVTDASVKRLERDCLGTGIGGCSTCLNSLYLLNEDKTKNTSNSEDRTSKMYNRDCELMGLTWLLAKNRSAYIHTVSAVLRAIMMSSTDASNLQSCSLNTDGMPLAVDSSQINSQSSSAIVHFCVYLILSLSLLYVSLVVSSK